MALLNYKMLEQLADHDSKIKAIMSAASLVAQFPTDALAIKSMNEGKLTQDAAHQYFGRKYLTPSDDTGRVTTRFFEFTHQMPIIDNSYLSIFQHVDMTTTKDDHYSIYAGNRGARWVRRDPGERIAIQHQLTSEEVHIFGLEFAAGVGIEDNWLRRNQWYKVDDILAEYIAKFYESKANFHNDLIAAVNATVIPFTTDDAVTFGMATGTIIRAMKEQQINLTNAKFIIRCATEVRPRIERMLTAQVGSAMVDYGTMSQPVIGSVSQVIDTVNLAPTDPYELILPMRKMKTIDFNALNFETSRQADLRATDITGEAQYNAVIADQAQIVRVSLS